MTAASRGQPPLTQQEESMAHSLSFQIMLWLLKRRASARCVWCGALGVLVGGGASTLAWGGGE